LCAATFAAEPLTDPLKAPHQMTPTIFYHLPQSGWTSTLKSQCYSFF
jgi:hypothetical protein